jgi:hypothetical protein
MGKLTFPLSNSWAHICLCQKWVLPFCEGCEFMWAWLNTKKGYFQIEETKGLMSWVLFPFVLFNYPLEAFQRRGSIAMLAGLQGVAVWELSPEDQFWRCDNRNVKR